MCMNNSDELLCGVPVTEYTRSRSRKRVRYCDRTKGLIVWGVATYGQRSETIAQSLKAGAPAPQLEAHINRLQSLCHMHHPGLDRIMHTWLNMLLHITDAYWKCHDFLGSEPDATTLAEWENDPVAAFAWLRHQNRVRKHAKALAKAAAAQRLCEEKQDGAETAGHHHPPEAEVSPAPRAKSLFSHASFSTLLTTATGVDLPADQANYIGRVNQYMRNDSRWDPERQRAPDRHEVSPSVDRWIAKSRARGKLRQAEEAAKQAAAESAVLLLGMEKEVERCRREYRAAKQKWKGVMTSVDM
ncbi:hypothetical protein CcaCcLH18_12288 [Colletotrichum camelliae]|nr:hypothetical protein CcaCcLH18_12288 [Colletotrichum camelliae]